jgi:hypothetical protein
MEKEKIQNAKEICFFMMTPGRGGGMDGGGTTQPTSRMGVRILYFGIFQRGIGALIEVALLSGPKGKSGTELGNGE